MSEFDQFETSDHGEQNLVHKLFDQGTLIRVRPQLTDEGKAAAQRMLQSGANRNLVTVPEDYRVRCDDLAREFPNFSEYIDSNLLPSLALARARANPAEKVISFLPTVFLGAPGIGKTLFASAVASKFGLDFDRVNLETSQAAFELVGTARGWTNSQPGRLFNWMTNSGSANGIFVCEELDKASSDTRFPTLNALIQLLEPTTAASFNDMSMPEVKLDLSKVNFLFTANSLEGVSAPILSRLQVVEVPNLTAEQARRVALNQYEGLLKVLNLSSDVPTPQLTESGLAVLERESPRRQRLLLMAAIGRAVAERAQEIFLERQRESKPRVGFL